MKEQRRFRLRTVLLWSGGCFLLGIAAAAAILWAVLGTRALTLAQASWYLENRFVAEFDRDGMVDSALSAMVDSLGDRWSYYLDPEALAQQEIRRENQYVGAGFTFTRTQDSRMEIVAVAEGGPAEQAGLAVGDTVVAIQGEALTEENFDQLRAVFQAEAGTEVSLTARDAQGEERELTLTLALIESDPVESRMLEGQLGYVRLENFYHKSAQRVREATDELAAQGARGLIFDVRQNPGGYVSELTDILDYLLPEGPIFTDISKNGKTVVTESDEGCVELPMVVLVDQNSYSAAEIFAAQLQESAGAGLVGQVTSGKGYYQVTYRLLNGGALGISIGRYGTGSGRSLIGTGLTPDVLEDDWDAQLEQAAALLEGRLSRNGG